MPCFVTTASDNRQQGRSDHISFSLVHKHIVIGDAGQDGALVRKGMRPLPRRALVPRPVPLLRKGTYESRRRHRGRVPSEAGEHGRVSPVTGRGYAFGLLCS